VVSLEQVRALEDRVEKAVAYISSLRGEGAELRRRLAEAQSFINDAANELAAAEEKAHAAEESAAAAEKRAEAADARAAELGARAEEYRKDQAKIEEGIVHALEKLDSFEDLVLAQAPAAEKPAATPKKQSAGTGLRDAGIAMQSAPSGPDAEDKSGSEVVETLENELDIF